MDRQILYPAQIPLVEDGLNAQRNAMVGLGHLAGAAFGTNTVAASGFACSPAEGLSVTIAPGALLAPGVVDASAYGTLAPVSSALVRQFISRDPVSLTVPSDGATYVVYVTPQTVDADSTVLPFYNAADPSVTYAGQNNSGLAAPTVRRDEAALAIGASVPSGAYPLWQIVVPSGATALTAGMLSIASGAPFYPSLAAVAPRIVAPFNAQLAAAMGGYPLNAVVADTTTPGTFWVSTADANVSVPGATGATWQSLFNGYATQAWANGQFLQLADSEEQTVTGPVVFKGATTVPDITDFTGKNALNAETADGRYIKTAESANDSFVTDLTVNKQSKLPYIQSGAYTGSLQPYLGYTPVQQGGGAGQGANKVALGWAKDGSGLKCQIDATDEGYISFRGDQYFVPFSGSTSNSSSAAASISFTPVRSGYVKIDFNVGQSSSNNISSININTSGLNSLGGGGNHSATNLYVSSLLYEVAANTQAVFTVEGIFAGAATATSVCGVATFIPYND